MIAGRSPVSKTGYRKVRGSIPPPSANTPLYRVSTLSMLLDAVGEAALPFTEGVRQKLKSSRSPGADPARVRAVDS
jgi:hypothetical protein